MIKAGQMRDVLMRNFSYKVVALFVALVLWLALLGRKEVSAAFEWQVDYKVASTYSLERPIVSHLTIEVNGPEKLVEKIKHRQDSVTIDLSRMGQGTHLIAINREKLGLPQELRVVSIQPNVIAVHLQRVTRKANPRHKERHGG